MKPKSPSKTRLNSLVLGAGNGQKILMMHGWGHSIADLRPLGELLSDAAEVHLIDLPGHGQSAEPDSVWGMSDFVEAVNAYLEANSIEVADFIGHSFGGKTAIKFSSIYPKKMRRLVLIDSSGLKPKRPLKRALTIFFIVRLRGVLKFLDRVFGLETFKNWFVPRFASADYLSAGSIRKTFVKTVNEHLHEEIKKINASTLILWGEKDSETPVEMAHRLDKMIRKTVIVVLPGKGHEPFRGEGAHLCAYHIAQFLGLEGKETSL